VLALWITCAVVLPVLALVFYPTWLTIMDFRPA
jgi:hypothetical protein